MFNSSPRDNILLDIFHVCWDNSSQNPEDRKRLCNRIVVFPNLMFALKEIYGDVIWFDLIKASISWQAVPQSSNTLQRFWLDPYWAFLNPIAFLLILVLGNNVQDSKLRWISSGLPQWLSERLREGSMQANRWFVSFGIDFFKNG